MDFQVITISLSVDQIPASIERVCDNKGITTGVDVQLLFPHPCDWLWRKNDVYGKPPQLIVATTTTVQKRLSSGKVEIMVSGWEETAHTLAWMSFDLDLAILYPVIHLFNNGHPYWPYYWQENLIQAQQDEGVRLTVNRGPPYRDEVVTFEWPYSKRFPVMVTPVHKPTDFWIS